MRSYRSATAPGLGILFIEGSKESLSTRLTRLTRMAGRWKGVLGVGTDCISKLCCRSQELYSVFAALGQRPPRPGRTLFGCGCQAALGLAVLTYDAKRPLMQGPFW